MNNERLVWQHWRDGWMLKKFGSLQLWHLMLLYLTRLMVIQLTIIGSFNLGAKTRVQVSVLDTWMNRCWQFQLLINQPSVDQNSDFPHYIIFVDNMDNLKNDNGTPLIDFWYAVKINSNGLYAVSDSDMHYFLEQMAASNKIRLSYNVSQ